MNEGPPSSINHVNLHTCVTTQCFTAGAEVFQSPALGPDLVSCDAGTILEIFLFTELLTCSELLCV